MNISEHGQIDANNFEQALWDALDMESFNNEMIIGPNSERKPLFMGTGHTHNACYMCSNSATTAGCGTCS